MPRAFSYTGPPCDLGRFGPVEDGTIVDLTFDEELCVTEDTRFTPVKEEVVSPIVPLQGTPLCDLRYVEWPHGKNPGGQFMSTYHGRELLRIAEAMVLIGCPIEVYEGQSDLVIADTIMREALRSEWHLMSKQERMACPLYEGTSPPEPPDPPDPPEVIEEDQPEECPPPETEGADDSDDDSDADAGASTEGAAPTPASQPARRRRK